MTNWPAALAVAISNCEIAYAFLKRKKKNGSHISYKLQFIVRAVKIGSPLPRDSSSSINHIDLIRVAKARPSSCWREPVFPPS